MRYLLFSLLLLPGLAVGEIYRWTDASGRQHFSEKPVPGAEAVQVRPQVVERDAATRASEERARRFFEARREEQAQATAQRSQEQAERRAECSRLRSELAGLERGGTFYREETNGQRSYYSEAQIEQARQQLRSRLSSRCSRGW